MNYDTSRFFLLSIEAFVELQQRYFLGSLGFIFD